MTVGLAVKPSIVIATQVAACAALFWVAPHHRQPEHSFKPSTLAGVYRGIRREVAGWPKRAEVLVLFAILGLFAAFYPVALVPVFRAARPAQSAHGGATLVVAGILAVVGAVVNFLAIVVSNMSFGWGVSQSKNHTPFVWVIPAYHLAFGVASIVLGASAGAAEVVERLLGP